MTALALIAELLRRGIRVWVEGGRLAYEAPRKALTPDLLEAMRAHKEVLRALLSAPEGPCPFCWGEHARGWVCRCGAHNPEGRLNCPHCGSTILGMVGTWQGRAH